MLHRLFIALVLTAGLAAAPARPAGPPPSVPAVDAPELAALGPYAVGVESLTLTQADQADVLAFDARTGTLPRRDRILPLDVWYPAAPGVRGAAAVYAGALSGESGHDVAFTTPGLAHRKAWPAAGRFPLVILAHGYGGTPAAMTWLAENLASKGYVVAAPHFGDPAYGDVAGFVGPLTRRPLDIAFVAAEARARAAKGQGPFAAADPARTVLIGYSMGGYGVLTAAGGRLAPALGPLTHGVLAPFIDGAARAGDLRVPGVVAVAAISPAGLFGGAEAWGATGLEGVTAPLLVIVGDRDKVVGYDPGPRTLWTQAIHAPRYLLTFKEGGHAIGMNPAPATMRASLWDQDWFEDPVWRKERVIGVQLHMITAFLDRYAKGETAKAAWLDVPNPDSDKGVWPAEQGAAYSALSPGAGASTIWKGFQRAHATGLELLFRPAK